eukprot:2688128-Rhodomonas_salina.1
MVASRVGRLLKTLRSLSSGWPTFQKNLSAAGSCAAKSACPGTMPSSNEIPTFSLKGRCTTASSSSDLSSTFLSSSSRKSSQQVPALPVAMQRLHGLVVVFLMSVPDIAQRMRRKLPGVITLRLLQPAC